MAWDTLQIKVWWNTMTPEFARDEGGQHKGPWGEVASREDCTCYNISDTRIPIAAVTSYIMMEKVKQENWELVSVVGETHNPDPTLRQHEEVLYRMFFKRPAAEE